MTKIIIRIMLVLSGIFVILAVKEEVERKRRTKRFRELNERFDKMMELVNSPN